MEKQQYSPLEVRKLEKARAAVRFKNFEEARHILLSMPNNLTAQKWLKKLDSVSNVKGTAKETYDIPNQYQKSELACRQCGLQFEKGALTCPQRSQGHCLYKHESARELRWGYFIGQLIFGLILGSIALYLFLLVYLDAVYLYLFIAVPLAFFTFLILKNLVPKVDRLHHVRTNEKWQRSSTFGVSYQPTKFQPQSTKHSPQLQRPLAYPASHAALYEEKLYDIWNSGFEDIEGKQLAYVLLSTILHLVTLGYLEVWYAPIFSKQPMSKNISRMPNNDFSFALTDLGENTKIAGSLERRIQKAIKSSKNQYAFILHNDKDWAPGVSLMSLMTVFKSSNSDEGNVQEEKRRDRQAAMRGLLRDAARANVLIKRGNHYQANPESELALREDASTLAQMMHDYYNTDTVFVKKLHQQMTNQFGHQQSMDMMKFVLGRNNNE